MITDECLVGCTNKLHHKNCNHYIIRIENNIVTCVKRCLDYLTQGKQYAFIHSDRDFYEVVTDKGELKRIAKFYFE